MIVVDATAWVDYLTGRLGDDLVGMLEESETASPPHVDFEVGSALRRMDRDGRIAADDAVYFISVMSTLPFLREREASDATDALLFVDNATYADGWYLAMARRRQAPVLTSDRGMVETAKIHDIAVLGEHN